MFLSVQKNLQHIDICTLRMSTSFEYIVDTSEKTESLLLLVLLQNIVHERVEIIKCNRQNEVILCCAHMMPAHFENGENVTDSGSHEKGTFFPADFDEGRF